MKKQTVPNLDDIHYDFSFLKKPKWILSLIATFSFILVLNFNLKEKIDNLVFSSLTTIPNCSINIDDYHINVLPLPHISFDNLNMGKDCFGVRAGFNSQPIKLENTKAFFRGPSLFPLGVRLKLETGIYNQDLNAYVTAGLSSLILEIKEQNISLKLLENFVSEIRLAGNVLTDLFLELDNNEMKTLNLKLQSKTFFIPSQAVMGLLNVPKLNIKNFFLTLSTEDRDIKVSKFILGDTSSPIRGDFKGSIKLNSRNIQASNLNLAGEISFADSLLNENFILKQYLQQFDKKDNFYQLQISGSPMSPKITTKR